jgi:hypothetical protein
MHIKVFVPQDENTARGTRALLRSPERARMSQMKVSGWGRRDTASIFLILVQSR